MKRGQAAALVCTALLLLVTAYPAAWLAFRALRDSSGAWTLANLRTVFDTARLREGAVNTLLLALVGAAFAVVSGGGLAALAARTDAAGRALIRPLALAPYLVPPIVASLAWIVLADGQGGLLNALLAWTGCGLRVEIFSFWGVALVGGLVCSPAAFLILHEAFAGLDGELEEVARVCGASGLVVWRRVILPAVWPALAAAGLLCALLCVAQFGVQAPIGMPANVWTLSTLIYSTSLVGPVDLGLASAMALLLAAAGAVLLLLQRAVVRRAAPRRANARPARRLALGLWRWPVAGLLALYAAVALLLPYGALLLRSLRPFNIHAGMSAQQLLSGWDAGVWAQLARDEVVRRAFGHSFVLATATAALSCLLGAVGGWVLYRGRSRGRDLLEGLFLTTPALSGVVVGLAVLLAFGGAPFWLYGTYLILLVAYVAREAATGLKAAESALRTTPAELDDAARVCGAGGLQLARRIWWPLLRPALAAGAALSFIAAFREVGASSMLYSHGREVLGSLLMVVWQDGRYQDLAALALAGGLAAMLGSALVYRVVRGPIACAAARRTSASWS
ncbi:MAG: ABC transporter permease subunit [Elusimicrobia bacterium]|nr:ABC transporter permease subunit [Elusimicrobiota bacterium]